MHKIRFLNDLEGEENSNPVKLVDSTYSLAQTTNNSPYSNTAETSKNKSIYKCLNDF